MAGPLGNGATRFDSVAVAQPSAIGQMTVAGVVGSPGAQRLEIGTQNGGMHPTSVPVGTLSRPAFAPGRGEVWVGQGSNLWRITTDGRTNHAGLVQIPSIAGGGAITAVRLSPDGSRIALAVAGANGDPALFIGVVVRSGTTAQVESPVQISPDGVRVKDVAWIDSLQLFVVAAPTAGADTQVFRVYVDGYDWSVQAISGLPGPPDSIAMTDGAPGAWVSAKGYVWEQNGLTWQSPVATNGQTQGTNPIYLG